MGKIFHEIRDPIHTFIKIDEQEKHVVDSRPLQRLRHIHHLAMSYLVYPGATHRRFEHSLGVMELAGRVYDVVTDPRNVTDEIRNLLPQIEDEDQRRYWRRVIRMAALCHDIGHLPFSHAAEKELLPAGFDHEILTAELIKSDEMRALWQGSRPILDQDDIVKLALGPKKLRDVEFSDWETILSEIIVGDAFGVDRMDYLLRDSWHAGVAYGRFDHHRLIDTLRILPPPETPGAEQSREPFLGVEEGGIQSAEALLLARYFMYSQVYFHKSRKIYDLHLRDFLAKWLDGGTFKTDVEGHLALTDNEVLAAMREAASDSTLPGHIHAARIMSRRHFRRVYERHPDDFSSNPDAGENMHNALVEKFSGESVRKYSNMAGGGIHDFPVKLDDGKIVSSLSVSDVLNQIPPFKIYNIYIDPDLRQEAIEFIRTHKDEIIAIHEETDND